MLKSTEIDKSIFYKWNLHNSKTMSGVRRTWVVCCLFWGFKRVMNKAIAGDKDMQLFLLSQQTGGIESTEAPGVHSYNPFINPCIQ